MTELNQPGSLEQFLTNGGRVIVTEERNLDRIEAVAHADVRFRAWHGERTLVVVAAQPRSLPGAAR